ncbi:MAG TPA: glycosyltransferase [Burkholderiaceae bacterium]|nr:glycosyltransferase [Burkholderiaceae bacterium]
MIPTLTGGGAERVVVTLLQHLDRARFDLTLAVVDLRDAVFRAEIPSDVAFIDLRCARVRNALPKVIALIWRLRPDVVLSTLGHLNLALAIVRPLLPDSARYIARETIVVSHGITEHARSSWWAWAYKRFYRRFDKVICQSADMRDDLVQAFSIDAQRIVVINNPVDVRRIAAALEAVDPQSRSDGRSDAEQPMVRLVAAGRLVRQKGFDLLIEAIALARRRSYHLTLLGEGPLRDSLAALARSHGLRDRVEFLGFQPNPYPYLARADAFVLSSRYEGFPNIVLEALACGTPVVAVPAPGGVREILQSIQGCVIAESITAPALAVALDRWQPSRIPPRVVDRYSVASIVESYAVELQDKEDRPSPAMGGRKAPRGQ